MKKALILLLAAAMALLCGCASRPVSSALLAEQLNAPERVDETVGAVTVAAPVVIPAVNAVDVVEAKPCGFSDEALHAFVKPIVEDGRLWYYVDTGKLYESFYVNHTPNEDGGEDVQFYVEYPPLDSSPYSFIEMMYSAEKDEITAPFLLTYHNRVYGMEVVGPLPLTDGRAEGCECSLEDAMAEAAKPVERLVSDYEMNYAGQLPVFPMYKNPQYYLLRYTRTLNGIPVTNVTGMEDGAADPFTVGQGVISVIVSDYGVEELDYNNPFTVGKTLKKNVELLAFEKIMEAFRTEMASAKACTVEDIRLGYMTVADGKGGYAYRPVWDFIGTDEEPLTSFLTLDAMTGERIDRKTCR